MEQTLNSRLLLTLEDRVSGPTKNIDEAFRRLRNEEDRMRRQFDHHRNMFAVTAGAAIAAGYAMREPIQQAAAFESRLEDIRQKADLSAEAVERMGNSIRESGLDTAQGASSIAYAVDSMVGAGSVTPEQATKIADPLGKASTAYRADPMEMADATSAMVLQLGLSADQIEKAYDIMAVAGKRGAFELKNMATEFPGVLASANALGVTGEEGLASVAAWLQIARRGTASGAEAATNYADFMNKINSEQAKKNFAEFGVDISAELASAIESGIDPVEHAIGIINKLLEGNQARIGELFNDKQVRGFIQQGMKGLEDYRSIRDEALAADGTVERDFAERMKTPEAIFARFEASIEELNITVGETLLPKLAEFAEAVTPMIDSVSEFVKANRDLVAAVLEITAALVGLKLLAHAGGMAGALLGLNRVKGAGGLLGLGGGSAGGRGGKAGLPSGGMPATAMPVTGSGVVNPARATGWMSPLVAWEVFSDMLSHTSDVKENGFEPWLERRAANDAAIEAALQNAVKSIDLWGFKPAEWAENSLVNPESGIGGGYTGPTAEQIEAVRNELADIDDEIALWGEEGLTERRASLVAKLAEMEAELAASNANLVSDFSQTMEQMRLLAAAGVDIPIRTSGPAIPAAPDRTMPGFDSGGYTGNGGIGDIAGFVHGREFVMNAAATRLHRPMLEALNAGMSPLRMPSLATLPSFAGASSPASQSMSIGDINVHVQTPTNADPNTIARAVGEVVSSRARAAFSDGAY